MKTEIIHSLSSTFEGHAQKTESGIEFWLARDLQHLLGYSKWENFLNAVSKAKTACEVSGHHAPDHFPDVRKMVDLGYVDGPLTNKAPKGRNTIAQGNALGMRIYRYPSPVRAQLQENPKGVGC